MDGLSLSNLVLLHLLLSFYYVIIWGAGIFFGVGSGMTPALSPLAVIPWILWRFFLGRIRDSEDQIDKY